MKKNLKKIFTIMLAVILLMQMGLAYTSAAGKKGPGRNNKAEVTGESKPAPKAPEKKAAESAVEEPAVIETPTEDPQEEISAEKSEVEAQAVTDAESIEESTEAIEETVQEEVSPEKVEEEKPEEVETTKTVEEEKAEEEDIKADEAEAEKPEEVKEEITEDEVVPEEARPGHEAVLNFAFRGATKAAGPGTEKKLIDNGDGTYTLALSVTGSQSSTTTTEVGKANVVLVIDTSSSMNYESGIEEDEYFLVMTTPGDPTTQGSASSTRPKYYRKDGTNYVQVYYNDGKWWRTRTPRPGFGGGYTYSNEFTGPFYSHSRLWAEKHVLTDDGGIIDSLLAQNVPEDNNKKDIIEVAIVDFSGSATQQMNFSTSANDLKTKINGLGTASGTNWEDALQKAKSYADAIKQQQPNEDVYVIMLTDGEPTRDVNNSSSNIAVATAWNSAKDDARKLIEPGKYTFYGLFTWGSDNNSHYLSSLVQYAYTGEGQNDTPLDDKYKQYFTDATSTQALINALNQIVHNITEGVGYTNVELEDGVTSMTASTVHATTSGTVTGVKYYRSGGKDEDGNEIYDHTANNGLGEEWTNAPEASINSDGAVDWSLGENFILENEVTYTITFVVWPKQESLDLVADLNNGIIAWNDLTDDQKSQISVSGTHYKLKTNTDFPTVYYSPVTTKTVDGETTTTVGPRTSDTIENPDPVSLAEKRLNAKKEWDDSLDSSQREEIQNVTLYLLKDGEYYYVDENNNPIGVMLQPDDWTESDYISIAPGILVTEDSPAYDPNATQVEWNGTTYAIIEDGHEYVFRESEYNNHFQLTAYTHHPMIMGEDAAGNLIVKDVVFTKDGSGNITGIESVSDMGDNISATNTLKGGINIKKKVVDSDDAELDSADPYEITVYLTDKDGEDLQPTTERVAVKDEQGNEVHDDEGNTVYQEITYTIDYRIYYGKNNPNYDEAAGGGRSDHIYVNESSFSEDLYVGDTIRVVNVPLDTYFYVDEELPAGFKENSFEYKYATGSSDEDDAIEYTEEDDMITVDGIVRYKVKGNSACYGTVINKLPASFYVYHSSDNTVERIALNDDRLTDGKFNIVEETKSGYIYGGYYKTYSKTTSDTEDIIGLPYETKDGSTDFTYLTSPREGGSWASDENGDPYDGTVATDVSVWVKNDAFRTTVEEEMGGGQGTAMTPKENIVYFLKEVPDVYLQPATYVVYDERDIEVIDETEFYQIKKLHLLTATDDENYVSTGFDVTTSKGINKSGSYGYPDVYWSSTVTVTKKGETEPYDTLNAGRLVSNHFGLIADKDITEYIKVNQNYKEIPYHITLDNVKITSLKQMTVFIKNTRFNAWAKPGMYKVTIAKKAAYAEVKTE